MKFPPLSRGLEKSTHTHTHTHTDAPEAEERAASEPKPSEPKPSGASDSPWNPGLNHTAGETGAGGKGGEVGGGGGGKPFGAFKNSLEELILRTARGGGDRREVHVTAPRRRSRLWSFGTSLFS